ncbi:hybrid sensor histidine kinase/response regulator [Achromobacter aloeverae]|uniref:histidine kinase n=1 Tax=Achromobacter aloeverae TaxID=1750518 RepID=A0A4Q1HMA5_9BURK|nr:PAS domain-containing sensor histidine kinase [Achromobacter aloeverae]RXN90317.1 hybrid sensor histidine kinase/response regulator [Achromobacter aloeverae]
MTSNVPATATPPAQIGDDRRISLLVDAIRDYAIYMLDANGYVSSWNPGAQRFKGYTASEIIGQHFSRFYTEEDRANGVPAKALRTAAENGSFEAEGWRVRKDGSRFWCSVVIDPVRGPDGAIIGYAKVTRDISDKKAARDALYASEQRFRLLVQGVRDYAIYMLDPDGYITNWNSGAQAIKGYTEEEVIGRHFSMFYTEEDRARGEPSEALEAARTQGKYQHEGWRVRKDGHRFWATVAIHPIRDENGSFLGYAKITRDVTEQREVQRALERSREALNQAQKMEAIGRLTGGVAHDFNNLLTVIRSSAELLRRPDLAPEKRDRFLAAIVDTATRAAELTRQLLAFARKQPLRPETFDVAERLRGMEHIILTSVGSPVRVEFELPEGLDPVHADPSQFETAVLNLVINARDAMPRGGLLRIAARNTDRLPAVRNHAGAQGAFVAVSVTDTGSGIAPEVLSRIFEPFFTTKTVNRGTGLGLSQAYGFAKQSGGELAVQTEVGVGTTFTLYFPRAQGTTPLGISTRAHTAEPPLVAHKVLLVEDNEAVGSFASNLLAELGVEVTWATDGQDALRTLAQRDGAFDLVFSDVVMPGMNGLELGAIIRQRWPTLRVVLTSGYSHVLAEEGVHDFELLEKPYSASALLAMLQGLPVAANQAKASDTGA